MATETDETGPTADEVSVTASRKQYRYPCVARAPAITTRAAPVAPTGTQATQNAMDDEVATRTTTDVIYPRNTRLTTNSSILVVGKHNGEPLVQIATGRAATGATVYPTGRRQHQVDTMVVPVTTVIRLAIVADRSYTATFVVPIIRSNASLYEFFRADSSCSYPFSMGARPRRAPGPVTVEDEPGAARDAQLRVHKHAMDKSDQTGPQSVSSTPSTSSVPDNLGSPGRPSISTSTSRPRAKPDTTGKSAAFSSRSNYTTPRPAELATTYKSQVLKIYTSFVHSAMQPHPKRKTILIPTRNRVHAGKGPPHAHREPLALTTFLP